MLDEAAVDMAIQDMHVGSVAHLIRNVLKVMKIFKEGNSIFSVAELFLIVINMSSLREDTMLLDWKNDFGSNRDMITRTIMYTNLGILGNRFRLNMKIDTMHDVIQANLFCASIGNEGANPTRQKIII